MSTLQFFELTVTRGRAPYLAAIGLEADTEHYTEGHLFPPTPGAEEEAIKSFAMVIRGHVGHGIPLEIAKLKLLQILWALDQAPGEAVDAIEFREITPLLVSARIAAKLYPGLRKLPSNCQLSGRSEHFAALKAAEVTDIPVP